MALGCRSAGRCASASGTGEQVRRTLAATDAAGKYGQPRCLGSTQHAWPPRQRASASGERLPRAPGRRWSFRWSFRHARHRVMRPYQLDRGPDLSSADNTEQHGVDGAHHRHRRSFARVGGPGWGGWAAGRVGRVWPEAGVRQGAGAAGLGTPWRSDHHAVGDPTPGQPPRATDRVAVRQPRWAWRLRSGRGRRARRGPGRDDRRPLRYRRLGYPRRRRRQRPGALLPRRG
jgi:hypothetical protein